MESAHVREIEEIKEAHEKELEELVDKYDEEQVVEFNLLDHEIDKLRDEKQELVDELETIKGENQILKQASDEVLDDDKMDRISKDYQLIKDQLSKIESLYKEEMSRREYLCWTLTKRRVSGRTWRLIWPTSAPSSRTLSTTPCPSTSRSLWSGV